MWEHLPNDMVVEILLRLPVKSLVRFRCVCKDWYSLISSEFFITTHANRAVSRSCDKNMSSLVLFWYLKLIPARIGQPRVLVNYHHCSLRSDDASFGYNDNFIDLNVARFYPSWTPPKIVGSCNGLVCTTSGAGKYVLWNPSIHRALRLPEPNLNSKHSHNVDYHGLGYDSSNNDIKLVRLVYQSTKKPPKVEIYSLKSSCWRCLTAPSPPYLCSWPSSSIFVSGASHWIAHTLCDQGTSHEVIMAFDMVDEVFHEVPFPACFVESTTHTATIRLALRDGLLCLVTYDRVQDQQVFSVWIMKEYGVEGSWTKLFNIHMNQRLHRVVGFRKNGEVLVSNVRGELLSYEPNTQQVTHLGFHRISTEEDYCRFKASYYLWENFVETMFLLNVKNGVL